MMLAGMNAGWSQSLDHLKASLSPYTKEIMTTLNPYIFFNGTCAEAFAFYRQCLGAEPVMMLPHRGTPAEAGTPPEWQDKIIHGRIKIGDITVMASDAPPGRYHKPQGFALTLGPKSVAEAERMFAALSESGQVTMPLTETFFASRFGMVTDRFAIPWMISCEKPA